MLNREEKAFKDLQLTKIQARVLSAFKLWISEYFYDYISDLRVQKEIQLALDYFAQCGKEEFILKIVKQIRALIDYHTKEYQCLSLANEQFQFKINDANDQHLRDHHSKGFFLIKPMEV